MILKLPVVGNILKHKFWGDFLVEIVGKTKIIGKNLVTNESEEFDLDYFRKLVLEKHWIFKDR